MRKIIAMLMVGRMAKSGFRFSKDYRHGVTRYHRIVYALVDTVGANQKADAVRFARLTEIYGIDMGTKIWEEELAS